jgi:hypothetical protein
MVLSSVRSLKKKRRRKIKPSTAFILLSQKASYLFNPAPLPQSSLEKRKRQLKDKPLTAFINPG